VQTENYVNSSNVTTTGNYNPYATDAPVKICDGVRNAYEFGTVMVTSIPRRTGAAGGNT